MRAAWAAPLAALWALAWVAGAAGAGAGAATVLAQQADLARAGSAALDYLPPPLVDRRARAPPRSPAGLPAPASGGAPAPPSLTRCEAPHPRPAARLRPVTRLHLAVARPRSQGAGPYAAPPRRMPAVAAAAVVLCARAAAPRVGAAAPHMGHICAASGFADGADARAHSGQDCAPRPMGLALSGSDSSVCTAALKSAFTPAPVPCLLRWLRAPGACIQGVLPPGCGGA